MVRKKVFILIVVLVLAIKSSKTEKLCRFMSPDYPLGPVRLEPQSSWKQLTGAFCYLYTNEDRLATPYEVLMTKTDSTNVFYSRVNRTTIFLYDYTNPTYLRFIKQSFKTDLYFKKWLSCSQQAMNCCENFMTEDNIYPTIEYPCPAIWDSWTCFAPAKAETVSRETCPAVTYSSEYPSCELKSKKECLSSNQWTNSTDYVVCSIARVLRDRHYFHIAMLAVAISLSFPAIIIFFSYRSFRQRIAFCLHRNLILVIIIRNVFTIMAKRIIILDELLSADGSTIMKDNSVGCRLLAFLENVSKNGIYACMLADGFYLHYSIVRPFADEPRRIFLYISVAILSLLPSLIWATLRALHNGQNCWMVDTSKDQWVSDGVRIAILAFNALLLLDIIRVMIVKLKRGGVSQQARTTLRVTLVLIPLFGIHTVVISNRGMVRDNSCTAQDVYYYISYTIEALQGILVALLFCYINDDVRNELKNSYRKLTIYWQEKSGWSFKNDKKVFKRRATTQTMVGSIDSND